jgi:hypothetical protein
LREGEAAATRKGLLKFTPCREKVHNYLNFS